MGSFLFYKVFYFLFLICLLLPVMPVRAEFPNRLCTETIQQETSETPKKDTIKLGIYVTQLFGLDSNKSEFTADYWIWMHYDGKKAEHFSMLEFFNSIETKQVTRDPVETGNRTWDSAKYQSRIEAIWNVESFPFDRHKLKIEIEAAKSTAELELIPDIEDSGINPEIKLDGWRLIESKVSVYPFKYPTKFGSPTRDTPEEYSRVVLEFAVERNAIGLFFKLHSGAYVAFLITILAYFMKPGADDIFSGRMSIIVSMLFATLVNLQIVESTIGKTNELSLSDKIHMSTMASIFISICVCLISRRLYDRGFSQWAVKMDAYAGVIQCFLYILINVILITLAATNH